MCETCGCTPPAGDSAHAHTHPHPHPHGDADHPHPHPHPPAADARRIDVGASLLARNAAAAAENRAWLDARGIVALNLMSSPGTGKTRLLERTLDGLRGRIACAVITGDVRTDHDARRLAGRGAPVEQIETVNACHLNAEQVRAVLPRVAAPDTRLLFIENVGNLVCPAAFDLGEHVKIALLSVTEGEDKPAKYPGLFALAQAIVLTKLDLAEAAEWDREAARRTLRQARPGVPVFEVSAKTGAGFDDWLGYLGALVR